jgi:asparagine synthase (glutamine-hydrolysing)
VFCIRGRQILNVSTADAGELVPDTAAVAGHRGPELRLSGHAAWRAVPTQTGTLWLKGHIRAQCAALDNLENVLQAGASAERIEQWLKSLHGHFALIFEGWVADRKIVFAAVDQVRSVPVFFAVGAHGLVVSDHAPRLVNELALGTVNETAALSLAMAGYTIGTDTLHEQLHQLGPGQWLHAAGYTYERHRYATWSPWRANRAATVADQQMAADVTLAMLETLVSAASGRPIAIALSAGLDSRVVASGLSHIGARNVRCYAYGLPGNYEAAASRAIAEKLGFDWTFVPLTRKSQRRAFNSQLIEEYLLFADSRSATPVLNDLTVTQQLLKSGFIDEETLIVNGNSGDFISGMHIAPALRTREGRQDAEVMRDEVVDALIVKHFRLWTSLATTANDARIRTRLRRELDQLAPASGEPEQRHGLYEAMEFRDRQSKFVIGRQRIYEFLGLEWALPLWDQDYLKFWEEQPLEVKAGQALYRDMAVAADWGGVWGPDWWPPRRLSPDWMRLGVRPLCKLAIAPFGKARWHQFERRFLMYWMDMLSWHGCLPYSTVAGDARGARHFIAWHTERYLSRIGLGFDGAPLPNRDGRTIGV